MSAGVRYALPESLIARAQPRVCASSAAASKPGRLVAHHQGLQTHRRENLPGGARADLGREPARMCEIAAQARLQPAHALLADHEPQLERAHAPPERNAPVAIVLHLAVGRGLQVARVGGHHAHQELRVAHEVRGAVDRHAQPLVRIHHQRIGELHAIPQLAALGQDHRRARHRRVHVQPQLLARARRCAMSASGSKAVVAVVPQVATMAQGSRPAARSSTMAAASASARMSKLLIHRNHAQVLAAEPGEQRGLLHRAVRLRGHVHHQRPLLALQAAARGGVVGGALARADQRDERRGGGGVLDHARPALGQPEHLPPPVEADFFELGERRTRLPVEPELAEPVLTRSPSTAAGKPLDGK